MKKMLLVVGVVLCLGAFALAAPKPTYYNFTFTGYCDGMSLSLSGTPKIFVAGTHNLYDCADNDYVGGFKTGISAKVQYPGSTGAVLNVSDPLFALAGEDEAAIWLVNVTDGTWVVYGSTSDETYLINEGTLTFTEDANVRGQGTKPAAQRQ
ncbi:MAG: hypothetical protein WBW53_22185 [Terriglobales bacterium]